MDYTKRRIEKITEKMNNDKGTFGRGDTYSWYCRRESQGAVIQEVKDNLEKRGVFHSGKR